MYICIMHLRHNLWADAAAGSINYYIEKIALKNCGPNLQENNFTAEVPLLISNLLGVLAYLVGSTYLLNFFY